MGPNRLTYLALFVTIYLTTPRYVVSRAGTQHTNKMCCSLSVPCDQPPLDISSTGCCSQSCGSWDDCLECSYDNYYLCVDQVIEPLLRPSSHYIADRSYNNVIFRF